MKMKQILAMVLCMALVACISVTATLAYLTSNDSVTNTFTVGKVEITMDETDTDNSTEDKERDTANEYHLLPGSQYVKDPTVHVTAGSEDCYVFVKIENGIADIEGKAKVDINGEGEKELTILEQVAARGWNELPVGVGDAAYTLYYKEHTKAATVTDYIVFDAFAIDGAKVMGGTSPATGAADGMFYIGDYDEAEVKVTAYAIQKSGFEGSPAGAWAAYAEQNKQ